MGNWEYKVISSGKGGFASPALMEKFINDLGQQQWEIIYFHTAPENALAFNGLARRASERDWTLEDAAAAAARTEADKLRAEFEAKFKAATGNAPAEEDKAETFLAEEKATNDSGLRRLRDTSRDADPDAPEEESTGRDEWDKLAEEDELPTFFDALRPHMRRNQRGPGMSVGVDFLAKKWHLEESDIKTALVECGMQIPADENAKPVFVEFEGDLFWVNINRRGETWINTREKPDPIFRVVQAKRLTEEETPVTDAPPQAHVRHESAPASAPSGPASAAPHMERRSAPEAATFLSKLRGLMRRNRRGHGWSGSFGFLTKALKLDEAALLAQLADHGIRPQVEGESKPLFHEEGDFVYWLNRNQRGETWINARKGRAPQGGEMPADGDDDGQASGEAPSAESAAAAPAPAPEAVPAPIGSGAPLPSADNTLAAVRLLLQPKKRGDGVAALVTEVAAQLGRPQEELLAALAGAGVTVPADPKAKPTFGEHGGEIFWLNQNARGELWLNAKASMAARKSRSRKSPTESAETEA
jgi:hypothetical protein